MNRLTTLVAAGAVALLALGASLDAAQNSRSASRARAAAVPAHPSELSYKPTEFEPPEAKDYRRELSNGVPVYMARSDEFPLVQIIFTFKGGAYLEPEGSAGLASATGAMMRRGGTESVSASDMDEKFDFLAANVFTNVGSTQSVASLNALSSNLDEAFALFLDMVRNPGFDQSRLGIYKDEVIQRMKARNDDANSIEAREWNALVYGRDHFEARIPTRSDIEAITPEKMRRFHARVFNPANLIIGVVGDFEEEAMLSMLEEAMSGWERGSPNPEPPAPTEQFEPGVYYIQKDIPQGKVRIGMRGIHRDHPDYFPMLLMNEVLGGGGFTSRLTKRIRSDEGLAYGAGSAIITPVWYPGEWRAGFQSKSPTVPLGIKIALEEVERIRETPISEDELRTAKNAFIETFPRTFESRQNIVSVFMNDEMTGRPRDYWKTYRDRVRGVTLDEVRRVAQQRIDPSKMAILIVGDWDTIEKGDLDGRATMAEFFDGDANELPLRDPMTLQPLPREDREPSAN